MYNILICDDERDIVSALRIYLSAEGYRIFEAHTGKEALDIVAGHEIHLILMDIMMPEMDGLETTKAIRGLSREDAGSVPIIAMSANAFADDITRSKAAGMNAHLSKPLDFEELFRTIKRYGGAGAS